MKVEIHYPREFNHVPVSEYREINTPTIKIFLKIGWKIYCCVFQEYFRREGVPVYLENSLLRTLESDLTPTVKEQEDKE